MVRLSTTQQLTEVGKLKICLATEQLSIDPKKALGIFTHFTLLLQCT